MLWRWGGTLAKPRGGPKARCPSPIRGPLVLALRGQPASFAPSVVSSSFYRDPLCWPLPLCVWFPHYSE